MRSNYIRQEVIVQLVMKITVGRKKDKGPI